MTTSVPRVMLLIVVLAPAVWGCTELTAYDLENTISSSGYPYFYLNNQYVCWILRAEDSDHHVRIEVDFFSTELFHDKVTIYDGVSSSGSELADWSGIVTSVFYVSSTSDVIYMEFSTDGSTTLTGWQFTYYQTLQTGSYGGYGDLALLWWYSAIPCVALLVIATSAYLASGHYVKKGRIVVPSRTTAQVVTVGTTASTTVQMNQYPPAPPLPYIQPPPSPNTLAYAQPRQPHGVYPPQGPPPSDSVSVVTPFNQ